MIRRIERDIEDLTNLEYIVFQEPIHNPFVYHIYIQAPDDSPYENAIFKYEVQFPKSYPFDPPIIFFRSEIFHPNLSENYNLTQSRYQNMWMPSSRLIHLIVDCYALFKEPDFQNVENHDALTIYQRD